MAYQGLLNGLGGTLGYRGRFRPGRAGLLVGYPYVCGKAQMLVIPAGKSINLEPGFTNLGGFILKASNNTAIVERHILTLNAYYCIIQSL